MNFNNILHALALAIMIYFGFFFGKFMIHASFQAKQKQERLLQEGYKHLIGPIWIR